MPIDEQTDSIISYDWISDSKSLKIEASKPDLPNENARVLCILEDGDTINQIINCSLVLGLNITEGILVVGKKKIYFISDLHYDPLKREVLNIDLVPKESRDINIELITGQDNKTSIELRSNTNIINSWPLKDIIYIIKKPFLLRDVGLEVMLTNRSSYFLSFADKKFRNAAHQVLSNYTNITSLDPILAKVLQQLTEYGNQIGSWNGITKANLSTKFSSILTSKVFLADDFDATNLWKLNKLSNFYYLMIVNSLAGRSINDVTQYPIFPWVIADYTSDTLDLNDPKTYRDLSKPMGAQSEKRMIQFMERYEAMKSLNNENVKPFHYGTHYSSAMIVSSYLVRLKPFTDSFLLLQGGQFGHADRLFNSIERTWSSAAIENTTDVRELIPEFYFLPEFLLNINDYNLGVDQNGNHVTDVILPPWANNDPKIFIKKNREALESKYVTEHLNEWIDLIFGYKQRGENAVKACNVFNKLSYPGAVNLDNIDDENERRTVTSIIHNFGQIPLQVFQSAHPSRKYEKRCAIIKPQIFEKFELIDTKNHTFEKVQYIKGVQDVTGKHIWQGYKFLDVTLIEPEIGSIRIRLVSDTGLEINGTIFKNIHNCPITVVRKWKENMLLTGDSDGLIKVWEYKKEKDTFILNELSLLTCHLNKIIQIETFLENKILITLDSVGYVYSWDMTRYQVINCFAEDGKFISISQQSETVGIITFPNNLLKLFTFNGSKYCETGVADEKKRVVTLQSLEIIQSPRHQYLQDVDYFVVGYSDCSISVYQLSLDGTNWEIKTIPILLHGVDTSKAVSVLSCIRMILFQQDCDKSSNLQLVLGYHNGTLETYSSTI